jgi:hypothetical protein
MAIVNRLSFEDASVAELAAELAVPVDKVRYHVGRMLDASLIELRGRTRRRGVAENLYGADVHKLVINRGDLLQLPPYRQAQINVRLLRLMFQEVMGAARAGTSRTLQEQVMIRFPLRLDEQGRRDTLDLHGEVREKILEAGEVSLRRLEESGEQPVMAYAMTLFFEGSAGD